MRFYNPDLTFGENAHNYAVSLLIIGTVLLLYALFCKLTAKTEEQQSDAKTIFNYGVPVAAVAFVLSLILFPMSK